MSAALLTLVLAACPAWSAEKAELFELKEGRFRLEAPAWERVKEKPSERRPKVHGTAWAGPEPGMSIAVEFYAPGNSFFKDAGDFLVRQSQPTERVRGRLVGKPLSIRVGGLKGRHWFREADGDMKSETVLLPVDSGFYVLTYTAPKKRFLKTRKPFQRALDTFESIPLPE